MPKKQKPVPYGIQRARVRCAAAKVFLAMQRFEHECSQLGNHDRDSEENRLRFMAGELEKADPFMLDTFKRMWLVNRD